MDQFVIRVLYPNHRDALTPCFFDGNDYILDDLGSIPRISHDSNLNVYDQERSLVNLRLFTFLSTPSGATFLAAFKIIISRHPIHVNYRSVTKKGCISI